MQPPATHDTERLQLLNQQFAETTLLYDKEINVLIQLFKQANSNGENQNKAFLENLANRVTSLIDMGGRHSDMQYETAMQSRDILKAKIELLAEAEYHQSKLKAQVQKQEFQLEMQQHEIRKKKIEVELRALKLSQQVMQAEKHRKMERKNAKQAELERLEGQKFVSKMQKIELFEKQELEWQALSKIQVTYYLKAPLPEFKGRSEEFVEMEKRLIPKESWVAQDPVVEIALYGPGGIGKSELACSFVNKNARHYSLIFWLESGNDKALVASYLKLAKILKISLNKKRDIKEIREKIFFRLENHIFKKPWLLILDNIEGKASYPSRGGFVIGTSRSKDVWAATPSQCIEMPFLSLQETIGSLREMLKDEDEQSIRLLATKLEGYPLALGQAANYICKERTTIKGFLESCPLVSVQHSDRYPYSLEKSLAITFEKLQTEYPLASQWLTICAFLHPKAIPVIWMYEWLAKKTNGKEHSHTYQKTIKLLIDYGLIKYDKKKQQISLHRLVQHSLTFSAEWAIDKKGKKTEINQSQIQRIEEIYLEAFKLLVSEEKESKNADEARTWLLHLNCLVASPCFKKTTKQQQGLMFYLVGQAQLILLDLENAARSYQNSLKLFKSFYGSESQEIINLFKALTFIQKRYFEYHGLDLEESQTLDAYLYHTSIMNPLNEIRKVQNCVLM